MLYFEYNRKEIFDMTKTADVVKTYKLANILNLKHYMKIAIDDEVETDGNGDFLVNVGYLRVSTDRQAELGYGLEIQEEAITNYCKTNGLKNLVLFIDDGFTGTNLDRPALQGLISAIQSYNRGRSHIRINSFIIHRIDRLSRSLLGTLQFIQDYIVAKDKNNHSTVNTNKEDITFISINEKYCNIEQTNPFAKMTLMLFATLAEFDRDTIVQKLKAGRTARVASGKWIGGGNVPYGYRYDKEQGRLVVVEEEADKIREVFRLFIEEQLAPQKIADRLGFKGDRIIGQMLRRKSLTGCIVYNGEEYAGEHEAIISVERWYEAQDELEKRSRVHTDSHYLLSGLVECGECGAKMRYQKWNKHGACKLVCYSRQKSKPNLIKDAECPSVMFWASDIEDAVVRELFRMTYLANTKNTKTVAVSVEDTLKAKIKKVRKLIAYYTSKRNDIIIGNSDEDLGTVEDELASQGRELRSLLSQLESEEEKKNIARKVERAKDLLRNLESTWEKMTPKERQTVCQELIDRIVIHKEAVVDVHLKLRSFLSDK